MIDYKDKDGNCNSLSVEDRQKCDHFKKCEHINCDELCEDCHHANFYRECTRPDEEETK